MNIPTKQLLHGFEMPVFGFGTWQIGGRTERNPQNDDQADITAIKNAIEAGITHIDTAEKYADGHAEELVGEAIKGYDRKTLFLVSKLAEFHVKYDEVLVALNASLERLKTDYLDLYMIHRPGENPIEETMKALNEAKDKGLIKNIALSNFTLNQFKAAQAASKHKIVAGQYHLNLTYREPERKGLLEHFQKDDIMMIAWRPVEKGMLSDSSVEIMQSMCKKYGRTPSQIAINWLISQKNVVTLAKMKSPEHLKENLGAVGWEMEPEDIEKLRDEFPDQKDVSDAVPLKE